MIQDAWAALRGLPEAGYLGLASPRFLLRLPYGKKTEPVDCFDFEEFTPKTGLRGMLWGNPAVIAGLLLCQTYAAQGAKMKLGSVLSVGEMPFYYFTDKDGDQVALPCTERLMTKNLNTCMEVWFYEIQRKSLILQTVVPSTRTLRYFTALLMSI